MQDLIVIGGGINGVGIALDARSRGLSVTLIEKDDLASGTSSKSSKLIHGGLRYLEHYEFKLVRESLKERNILFKNAPHLIQAIPFIIPYNKSMRPKWMIRAGLFLYDLMTPTSRMPKSKMLDLTNLKMPISLKSEFDTGFTYSDCITDDARLVISCAILAHQIGCKILTRHTCVKTIRHSDHWEIEVKTKNNELKTLRAKCLINATGPWVDDVLNQAGVSSHIECRKIKGSHIVVDVAFSKTHAFLIQNTDKRIIFVIPYGNGTSLIGTTESRFKADLNYIEVTGEETSYLLKAVNQYFNITLTDDDIIFKYAGVRPLYGSKNTNISKLSRDYHLELNTDANKAPLLTVYGGKLTTYRVLSEKAVSLLKNTFPDIGQPCSKYITLPGGEIPNDNIDQFEKHIQAKYPQLPQPLLSRYAISYGSRCNLLLDGISELSDLGTCYGNHLYEKEVDYLITHEWATTVDDILYRRTKLGIKKDKIDIEALQQKLDAPIKAN